MKNLNRSLVISGGVLYLLFGVFHLTFFRVFNTSNPDFNQIVPFLGKIMIMLNIGIVVLFISMGVIMLRFCGDIIQTNLGRAFLIMSALFFIIRGSVEFAFPAFKIAFVITMFVISAVYLIPALNIQKDNLKPMK